MLRFQGALSFCLVYSLLLFNAFAPNAFIIRSNRILQQGGGLQGGARRHGLEFPEEAEQARGVSSQELRQMSEARRRRLDEEQAQKSRFVTGDALHRLRQEVLTLSEDLHASRTQNHLTRVHELEEAIWHAQQVDAEYVYHTSLQRARAAEASGLIAEAYEHRREAARARSFLPQFNMNGLWVGKYGQHGFEMINVTYVGDVLVAYKVTGDQNVPKGEISFTVDLGVQAMESMLGPIELTEQAAQQWGSTYLQRFVGQGQVAGQGFVNSRWMEGQMILVNQYFSFAWLPIGHQVFFARPSPELTLKLLRESRANKFSDQHDRDLIARCMDETNLLEEDMALDEGPFRSHNQDDYYSTEGCWE